MIQSDGYSAYDEVAKHYGLVHCGCIAHARRKFFEAIKALPKNEQKSATAAHDLHSADPGRHFGVISAGGEAAD